MRHASLVSAVFVTLATLGASRALAENIADAWRMAREADGSFAAAQNEAAAADSAQAAAERQRWPVLRVTGSYTQLNQSPALEIATPAGEFRSPKIWQNDVVGLASAEVSVPLWTAGRLSGAIGSATDEARAAAAQMKRAGSDLELAVVEAYLGVLRARSALAVAESDTKSLDAHADAVRIMYEKEAVPHLQHRTYLEPFALRALGVVREDYQLVGRAAEHFEAFGLGWHASRTWALQSSQ